MSSPDSRLRAEDETPLKGDGVRTARPMESESRRAPASAHGRTESLLAAEKRTLEMLANGASLSEVLNDLCAHRRPRPRCYFNGLFDGSGRQAAVARCRP